MTRRPFEIIAECEMRGFPAGTDIARLAERLEQARRTTPDIVRATVNPPAVYRKNSYILEARLVVWADDASRAVETAKGLVASSGVPCRSVLPSARVLTPTEVPLPSGAGGTRRVSAGDRAPATKRASRTRRGRPRPRAA